MSRARSSWRALTAIGVCLYLATSASAQTTGAISGTAVDANTAAPVSGVCAQAIAGNGGGSGGPATGADGTYTIAGLGPGDYTVLFSSCGTPGAYADQYFDRKTDPASADRVTVSAGATRTGVDARLVRPSTITGRVTNRAGAAVPDISVGLWLPESRQRQQFRSTHTDAAGEYTFSGLAARSYVLSFWGVGDYVVQWFDGKPDFESADLVAPPVAGTAIANQTLSRPSTISGRVTDASGAGLANASVTLWRAASVFQVRSVTTDSAGYYSLTGLPAGPYKVEFGAPLIFGSVTMAAQWYTRKPNHASADTITLGPEENRTGVDAQSSPSPAGTSGPGPTFPPSQPQPPGGPLATCVVPKVKGKTVARAKAALVAAKCKAGKVKRTYSRTVKRGRVISSRPAARKVLPVGTKVALVASKGRPRKR